MEYGWLYLHFLDRELLTTCALYGNISTLRIHDDFVLSLISITEPAYISASVLFESDYAFELFSRYRAIFSRRDLLRLAGAYDQLGEFIQRKMDDYSARRSRYARYFTDSWKDIEDAAPTLAVKRQDTTRFLQTRVEQRLIALPAFVGEPPAGVQTTSFRSLIERLRTTLRQSGNAPVTPHLFESVFREVVAQERWRYHSNLQISLSYVESYMNEYGGTIPTGLKCGLRAFDCLSRTFPVHCLDIWREIYTTLGVYPRILVASAEEIVRVREMELHASFVRAVRGTLERDRRNPATPTAKRAEVSAYDVWSISQRLVRCLPKCAFDQSTSFVNFVDKALRLSVSALEEHGGTAEESQLQSPRRERSDEPAFYLDAEQGALKGTDGRVIALDERIVRVLLALAGEVPGLGRRGPLGRLSDGAVASLYAGIRREWSPVEAAKITYQFTRVLRRNLSRAGVRDRDAIVTRLWEKGVAMGTRWARPAVRGKSEVRLLMGRRRDIAEASYDELNDER